MNSCKLLRRALVVTFAISFLFTLNVGLPDVGSTPIDTNAPSKKALLEGQQYPGCPPPVLPQVAFFLAPYANLELTITAGPDGTVKKVIVSKRSEAKLYDENTRKWVETHWKMPAAKPGEPEERKFIAPIVYPKSHTKLEGYYPPPEYPYDFLRNHVEGLIIIEIKAAQSGNVESALTVLSSGHKGLDDYSCAWVKKKWKFPPGEEKVLRWPVSYMIK